MLFIDISHGQDPKIRGTAQYVRCGLGGSDCDASQKSETFFDLAFHAINIAQKIGTFGTDSFFES